MKFNFSGEYKMFFVFLLSFILIYGGMNLYFYIKAKNTFNLALGTRLWLLVFVALMIFAPIVVHMAQDKGAHSLAKIIAYIGYNWIGFIFLFCFFAGVLEIFRFMIAARPAFFISFFLSMCAFLYGYFEAKNVGVKIVKIATDKSLGPEHGIKLVQVSDLHLGLMFSEERLNSIVEQIKKINPDMLVSTGDLVDALTNNLKKDLEMLKEIQPKYGKYAVTGNHEFYAGVEHSIKLMREAGFSVLRGECVDIPSANISICGIDDSFSGEKGFFGKNRNQGVSSKLLDTSFNIFLRHRPLVDGGVDGKIDLQLSGHTHEGQIFPFNFVIKMFYSYYNGLYTLANGSYLYVSPGTGTWGPLIRVMAPPEITVFEIGSGK